MNKLLISPDQDSYELTPGMDAIGVDYGGGAMGIRRHLWSAPSMSQANWTLNAHGYTYFMAFYRGATVYGSLPFLIDLVAESSVIEECKVKFFPGSIRLAGKQGSAILVSASLQIALPLPDLAADQDLIDSYVPPY